MLSSVLEALVHALITRVYFPWLAGRTLQMRHSLNEDLGRNTNKERVQQELANKVRGDEYPDPFLCMIMIFPSFFICCLPYWAVIFPCDVIAYSFAPLLILRNS